MIEILKETAVADPDRGRQGYVTVRFTGRHATIGAIEVVRTFRLPPAQPRERFLQEEYDRWVESLDRAAEF